MIKQLILGKVKEYLNLKGIKTQKIGKMITFNCLWCGSTANSIPNSTHLNCLNCQKRFNLLDVVRKLENKEGNDDEIIEYLKGLLKIDGVVTKKEENKTKELLDFYEKMGFELVPVAKGEKYPIEKNWTNKSHKNKEEWEQWLSNSLNLGVKCGAISNITVIDIDTKQIPEELKNLLGNTLIQKTPHGWQYYYKFEEELPKTRIDEYKIDLETTGGQVVIEPSFTDNKSRNFLELKDPIKMPDELKKFLLEKVTVPRKTNSEIIKEDITTEDFKLELFPEGTRNSSLIKLGGIIRKFLNIKQTEKVLQVLNNHNVRSGDYREIQAMVGQLDKYIVFDEQELAHEILEHVREVKEVTKSDLELGIIGDWTKGEAKKRFNKAIQYLIAEERIIQRGKKIKAVLELDWTDTLLDEGTPVDFKVPYFHDYAYFCKGDIIIIGSQKKYGKTHLAMNFVKRLVAQGIKPCYVYNEKQGGRFAKIALHLGLKDGDFEKARCSDPEGLVLRNNSITIYDWVRPNEKRGFARTDLLFSDLVQKTEKTNSFLICFVQLRRNNVFFADDQIGQDTSLLVRYLYEIENEGMYTKFVIDDARERKFRTHSIEIPSIYNKDTKEVKLVEELSQQEQKNIIKKKEKFKK